LRAELTDKQAQFYSQLVMARPSHGPFTIAVSPSSASRSEVHATQRMGLPWRSSCSTQTVCQIITASDVKVGDQALREFARDEFARGSIRLVETVLMISAMRHRTAQPRRCALNLDFMEDHQIPLTFRRLRKPVTRSARA